MQLTQCRKRSGVFCLHLVQNVDMSSIITADEIGQLQSAHTGSNGVEYAFATSSVPCTC